jgi:hypothetical protein
MIGIIGLLIALLNVLVYFATGWSYHLYDPSKFWALWCVVCWILLCLEI